MPRKWKTDRAGTSTLTLSGYVLTVNESVGDPCLDRFFWEATPRPGSEPTHRGKRFHPTAESARSAAECWYEYPWTVDYERLTH